MALRLATFGHILDPIFHLTKKTFIHIESKLQHFSLIIILPSSLWPPDSDLALICSVGKTKIQFHARIFDLVLGLFPLIICLFIYLFGFPRMLQPSFLSLTRWHLDMFGVDSTFLNFTAVMFLATSPPRDRCLMTDTDSFLDLWHPGCSPGQRPEARDRSQQSLEKKLHIDQQ